MTKMESDMKACVGVVVLMAALGAEAVSSVFEMPQVFPKHVQLQQRLIQTVRAGRTDEMERVSREGVALMPNDANWQYNLACALAYRADKGEALEALERAIMLGFRDPAAIRADNDLKQLTALPKFEELVKKAEALRGKPVEGVPQVSPSVTFMGLPAEVHGSNTVWDFDAGCFKTLFDLKNAELRKVSSYAPDYHGPAAELISGWLRDDAASGNFGDLYVNRDGDHSPLAVTNFPGLTPVAYGAEARAHNVNLGIPNSLFEQPVIGNASMSMTQGPFWRSLPRAITTDPYQPIMAFRLYLDNQCWFYPEHQDYDPGTGDLYPANTPYYVISQGSSNSDVPFMEAFAAALAALKPAVKRDLAARKWLAPTLQMIFRATQKTLKSPDDYLTGAAHPVVFDAKDLDAEAMVKLANALKTEDVTPPVMLRTVKDAQPEMGVDFFDIRPEGLFDTPFAIARVVRGVARQRSMTLEASSPVKADGAAYRWVVLQGDPAKVAIKPLTPNASQVEITVAYHGVYRPKGPVGLQTGRVDIGCFLKTGQHWSAPSFVSFYYLPNEDRIYREDGSILSVDYANASHRYADPVLTMAKGWKDLYEHDDQGRLLGWYRTRGTGRPERFTWRGHRVLATDAKNRPTKACAVQYKPRQSAVDGIPPTFSSEDTPDMFTYTYANDEDKVGKASPEK